MAPIVPTPAHHVLDFFCDEEGSCALTVLVRGFRFHIIADHDELKDQSELTARYHDLVQRLRSRDNEGDQASGSDAKHSERDSGVDISADQKSNDDETESDPEEALQQWMLSPLKQEFDDLAETREEESVQEWYHGPTYFYNLVVDNGERIKAIQLEASDDLSGRMEKLKPEIVLPKYLTDKLDVRTYQASDLTVIGTSDQPPGTPYHPCRVRTNDSKKTMFLKIVDNGQPQPVKRELHILHQSMQLKLKDEINVPSLEGLVAFDDASLTRSGQSRIMGFLLTDIPKPQPLTGMLDTSVPHDKRERWAKEADHAKQVLHEHGIVWGDAKADNFVVDKDDQLWIIDFGGSYTEGWVDADIKETMEGDDMGTDKIVNALNDPVANTCSPDEAENEKNDDTAGVEAAVKAEAVSPLANKRKREVDDQEAYPETEEEGARKATKQE